MNTTQPYQEGDTLKDSNGQELKLFGLDYTQMVFVAAKNKTFTIGDINSGGVHEKETDFSFGQDYFIGRFVVTQALYESVMSNNPSVFKDKNRPVENVSWNDIIYYFLPKLNSQLLEIGIKGHFTLPSQAQWKYAAAGGQDWNNPNLRFGGSNNAHDVGWFSENSNEKSTFPVGLKAPNALGLYDMSGNVWEWCLDDLHGFTHISQNSLIITSQENTQKVLRGGCYANPSFNCSIRIRTFFPATVRSYFYGFRLAFTSDLN
jgi:formylglycine-generating enzyme required for sulfatase activity